MKKILIIAFCFLTVQSYGQNAFTAKNSFADTTVMMGKVGIGTATPAASAILDISSTTSGILIPRMTYAQRNAISSPATGLLVFNTQTNKYNYYNGSSWPVLSDSASAGTINSDTLMNYWRLTGNTATAGTLAGSFLGTTNNVSLRFRTNNIESAVLDSNGRLGVGDITPASLFTVGNGDLFQINTAGKIVKYANTTPSNGGLLIGHTANGTFEAGTITSSGGTIAVQLNAGGINIDIGGAESTYTPTLTNTTNIAASTAYTTYYKRVGDWVHVWGDVSIDATAATTISEMAMSLPVASAVPNTYELAGTASFEDNTSVQIKGDVGNSRALFRFTPQSATNNKYSFHFSYKYIAP